MWFKLRYPKCGNIYIYIFMFSHILVVGSNDTIHRRRKLSSIGGGGVGGAVA